MDLPVATGTKATKGLELFTHVSPNGVKVSIMLEELKAAYPDTFPGYTFQAVDIQKNIQKEPWFIELCPNGRIPVLVDHDRQRKDGKGPVTVWEGIAILGYLARRYDPDNKIGFDITSEEYDEAEVWMGWQHGGVGPMQGQANVFLMFAPVEIPFAAQRYVGEVERLYGVLNTRLGTQDYVVGGRFSVADICLLGWAQGVHHLLDEPIESKFPNVSAWRERCMAREGVKKGMAVPFPSPFSMDFESDAFKAMAEKNPFLKAMPGKIEKARALTKRGKEEFNYVYKSP